MRKITLILLTLISVYKVTNAQTFSKSYSVNETFDGTITSPWGFVASGGTLTGSSGTDATLSNNGSNVYTLTHSNATFSSTKTISGRPETVGGSDSIVYIEFKWYNHQQLSYNVDCGWLRFMNGSKEIMTFMTGVYDGSTASTLRLKNFTPTNDEVTAPYNITKIGVDPYVVSTTGTVANLFPRSTYMRVKARFNFNRHQIDSLYVVRLKTGGLDDATTGSYLGKNIPFLDNTASQLDAIVLKQQRSHSTSAWAPKFEDFQIYSMKPVAGSANVTVNYIDEADGFTVVKSVIHANTPIDVYIATTSDKATFTYGGYYCVYDALQTSSESVTVTSDGLAHLDLKVKRFASMTGNYKWTGATSSIWNELNANFSTDGLNSLGYQTGNDVELPTIGSNKTITISDAISLGSGSLTISGAGYSTTGIGSLNGSGQLNINLSSLTDAVSLGVTNNMTGGTQIAGGTVTVSKVGSLGNATTITGSTTLIPSVALPATTFNASSQINPSTASSIAGITAGAGIKVSISSTIPTSNAVSAFLFTPSGTLTGGTELEFNGNATTETRYGMTSATTAYLQAAKVSLKGNAFLYLDVNQGASSIINIGTLSGEASTKLGWGRSSDITRNITWSVGSLGQNSEYAGTITNTGGYSTGAYYIGNQTNFTKTGAGTLTFSGTANTHNGNFVINGGELQVTGTICNTTGSVAGVSATDTVCVASGGKLSGNGTIGGNTGVYINGILDGSLHFGGSLKLAGTTNITGTGFKTGEFNVINVIGAVTNGGTLNVNIATTEPTGPTTIKIINAGSYVGTFSAVNVTPAATSGAGWGYNNATGELTYYPLGTKLQSLCNNIEIYPTLTHGEVQINAENISAIEVVNLMGQSVKQIKTTANNNTINLTGLSNGAYFVKVQFADRSVKAQRILLQK